MHLSNLCANLKSGWLYHRTTCIVANTKTNKKILQILWLLGYINGFSIIKKYKISVILKLKINFIKNILLISKPGRRVFCKFKHLLQLIKLNKGIYLLHTNKGLLTHKSCLFWHISGESLCIIY